MKNKFFINLFLFFTKMTGLIPALLFLKPRVFVQKGAKRRLPKNCILVSNHKSLLDFVLYLVVFPFRTIHFLIAEVLYNKSSFFTFLLNSWGGIKVERDDRDFSFVSEAIEVLDKGGIVGVFPEARLPINNKPWPFTTSTAFIALHSDAPIVPVYTDGNYGLFKRASVCIGKPIYAADYCQDENKDSAEQITHLTNILEKKVYELKDEMMAAQSKHPLFSFKNFPMDIARLVCSVLLPILRIKRLTPDGKKYKNKVKGGAIITANHTSFLDPFIVGITFWYRRMHFLVAEVVMKGKLRTLLLKGVGAIKIDRNCADIEAINKSVDKLKGQYLLTVFPQGEIHREDNVDSIKSGAVLMAFRAGVPIIPMYIAPREHWYKTRSVYIGAPINPKDISSKKLPSTADIQAASNLLLDEINRCKSAYTDKVGGNK